MKNTGSRMGSIRKLPWGSLALVALTATITIWVQSQVYHRREQLRNFEDSPTAFLIMMEGGAPNTADIQVMYLDGNPVTGARVHVNNNSGGNAERTDAKGRARIYLGESEIDRITLEDDVVLDRPEAYWRDYPNSVGA